MQVHADPARVRRVRETPRSLEELRWTPEDGGDRVETYALFSRSGFTLAVEEAAEERDDLKLFSAEDVVEALS